MLDQPGRLGKILVGMNRALGEIPLTIKIRTGVKEGKNTVHKLMPRLDGWGVGAVTVESFGTVTTPVSYQRMSRSMAEHVNNGTPSWLTGNM